MGNLYKIYRMRNDLELNLTKDTFHIVSHYLRKLSSLQKHREVYCGTEVLSSFPKKNTGINVSFKKNHRI